MTNKTDVTPQHQRLVEDILRVMGPRHKFTILIDGVDGAGKSPLGRFLAWRLEIPLIETDLLLVRDAEGFKYRLQEMRNLIDARHSLNRPVTIEGVCVLRIAEQLGLAHDYLIRVEREGCYGSSSFQEAFAKYELSLKARFKPNFIFQWDTHE